VGAARFLRGLTRVIEPRRLLVVGNTADDEDFFGLHVSPDLDTLTYTLAGVASRRHGWGLRDDSFACLRALDRFYGRAWFRLGDRDLATSLYRTERLRRGDPLSRVTREVARRFGVEVALVPMTDDSVRTFVHTTRGRRPFQAYLVHDRARQPVHRLEFAGLSHARPAPGVLAALERAEAVVIPPSNPLVSIGPILGVRGVRARLRTGRAPVAAISPLVGGRPVKGPADRMLRGLGLEVSPLGVARLYGDFIDVFVLDRRDAHLAPPIEALGARVLVADTLLTSPARAAALARRVLATLSVGVRNRRSPGRRRGAVDNARDDTGSGSW
jgi:LPPG:FO 2-phospho-L-lactate transferase